MKISTEISKLLSTVTFVATVMVVMCHCDDVMSNRSQIVNFLGGIFTDANVANFFFLSGFFVARGARTTGWYKNAIIKRFRTLGVPYVAWCCLYSITYLFFVLIGVHSFGSWMINPIRVFGLWITIPPIDFALWYIKALFYFILILPIFVPILRGSFIVSCILVALLLGLKVFPFFKTIWFFYFNLVGFACFLFGATVSFHDWAEKALLRVEHTKWGGVWLIFWAVSAWLVTLVEGPARNFIHPYYVVFAVCCLIRFIASIQWRANAMMVGSAFMIYASHLMTLKVVSPFVCKMLGAFPIICFVSLVGLSVSVGIALTLLLRKCCPKLLVILTGGRGN